MSEPAITRRAANDSGEGNLPINVIVFHATCGGRGFPHESESGVAKNTASYFAKKATQASAHYIEDIESEEHCLPESVVGWHAPPNEHTVGIEICGEATYTREQWLSPEVWPAVQRAAARAKDISARHDVPLVKLSAADLKAGKRGYCGHADRTEAFHESSHTDPGLGFPWDRLAEELGVVAPPVPRPTPAPGNQTNPPKVRRFPAWPLKPGNYFGNIAGPAVSHGGFNSWERPTVRLIQQKLIELGCVSYVSPDRCLFSSWADGVWGPETDAAMVNFHAKFYPGQPFPKQCWADDYARLDRA